MTFTLNDTLSLLKLYSFVAYFIINRKIIVILHLLFDFFQSWFSCDLTTTPEYELILAKRAIKIVRKFYELLKLKYLRLKLSVSLHWFSKYYIFLIINY
jgi:hypothetical protein